MVDPRIYRAGLALVAIAVIVFGFSLQPAPAPATTPMTPPAYAGPRLHALAGARTAAGSEARFATYVEGQLSGAVNVGGATGFDVAESSAEVQTATGMRSVPVVTASRTGVQAGTIVVVADRDAPGEAGVSGTAVLIGLAHALAGESQNHSIVLVSIGAPVGSAGATALARSLARAGQSIDAVLVLGDLAAAHPSEPVVVPFSDSETVAPPALTLTVARYLRAQTGIAAGGANFGAQLAHLAIPLTLTEQGPFAGRGMPGGARLARRQPADGARRGGQRWQAGRGVRGDPGNGRRARRGRAAAGAERLPGAEREGRAAVGGPAARVGADPAGPDWRRSTRSRAPAGAGTRSRVGSSGYSPARCRSSSSSRSWSSRTLLDCFRPRPRSSAPARSN